MSDFTRHQCASCGAYFDGAFCTLCGQMEAGTMASSLAGDARELVLSKACDEVVSIPHRSKYRFAATHLQFSGVWRLIGYSGFDGAMYAWTAYGRRVAALATAKPRNSSAPEQYAKVP